MYARGMEDGRTPRDAEGTYNRTLQRYGFIIPWQDATAN
jgi:hypothetical protein